MIPALWIAGAAGLVGGGLAAFSAAAARKAEAAVPPAGTFIEVNGDHVHYVDRGSGPPMLLIHGLGAVLQSFAPSLVDDLARDYRVVLIDRPGSGYSTRAPGASASLFAQAETVAAFIRALGLEKPLLVGHSLGGALSLALALEHPELVGGLALVTPLTQVQEEPPPVFEGLAIRSPLARGIVAWTIAMPLAAMKADEALRQVFHPEPVPATFPTVGGGMLAARPGAFYASSSDMVAVEEDMPKLVARHDELRLPVGILYAKEDNLLDYRLHGERTAGEIAGARLELVEGGHMLPFTQPELTARFIRQAAGEGIVEAERARG
jgi:pimeloyl-ACP methyl ester carboxylesterase